MTEGAWERPGKKERKPVRKNGGLKFKINKGCFTATKIRGAGKKSEARKGIKNEIGTK